MPGQKFCMEASGLAACPTRTRAGDRVGEEEGRRREKLAGGPAWSKRGREKKRASVGKGMGRVDSEEKSLEEKKKKPKEKISGQKRKSVKRNF